MSELGFLDQAMFKLEVAGMSPMYMGGAFILDTRDCPHPLNPKIIGDHVAACLEEVPLMRQRLVQDPLKLGDLRLVEDPDFDVRNHVTYTTLDPPGGYDELTQALGEFSSRRLDLNRPLWHFEIIDGLAEEQIAIAAHIHHTILDGAAGMRILGSMFSEQPVPGRRPRRKRGGAPATPTAIGLLSDALLENMRRLYIQTPAFIWRNARPTLTAVSEQILKRIRAEGTSGQTAGPGQVKVHKTSLNVSPISPGRAVAYLELPLDEVKALRRNLECSVNDLVLLLSSVALEHYFSSIGEQIDFDLVAGLPVDIRAEGNDSAGNALAFARVNLHNTTGNLRARLKAIKDDMTAIKRTSKPSDPDKKEASKIDLKAMSALFSPLFVDVVALGIVRFNLIDKLPLMNVGISNLPGTGFPPYLAGAKIRSVVPLAPMADSLALTITATSTDKYLVCSFHGCGETISNPELFVEGAQGAFQSLKRSSRQSRKSSPRKKSPKKGPISAAKSEAGAGGRSARMPSSGKNARNSAKDKAERRAGAPKPGRK